MFQASKVKTASRSTPAASLLSRLKDPQVWVCAIAAFTLVGLSSGLLGAEQAPQSSHAQLMASAK
jgi:hypothetical protein